MQNKKGCAAKSTRSLSPCIRGWRVLVELIEEDVVVTKISEAGIDVHLLREWLGLFSRQAVNHIPLPLQPLQKHSGSMNS